jgi:hypothetical protein
MKKLIFIAVLLSITALQQGCSNEYRPNTRKGWHIDEKNKHTRRIAALDNVIYEQNERTLPMKANQFGDTSAWQDRMRSRMQGMKE